MMILISILLKMNVKVKMTGATESTPTSIKDKILREQVGYLQGCVQDRWVTGDAMNRRSLHDISPEPTPHLRIETEVC